MSERPHRPYRRLLAVAAACIVLACAAGGLALSRYVDAIGPLDLSRVPQGSTVVLDREGRLLRAFTTGDGRWRLPLAARDVDPRYLAILSAYETHRVAQKQADALALIERLRALPDRRDFRPDFALAESPMWRRRLAALAAETHITAA